MISSNLNSWETPKEKRKIMKVKGQSPVRSPISLRNLRRQKLKYRCHVVWLKLMTQVKIAANCGSALISISFIVLRIVDKLG